MTAQPDVKQERRSGPRLRLRTNAFLLLPDGRRLEVRTLDISGGGMGIVADVDLRSGSLFGLSLSLPLRPRGQAQFEVRVQVVNCVFDGTERGFRIGLEFLALGDEPRKVLERVFA